MPEQPNVYELADSMLEALEEKLREQIDFEVEPSMGTVEGWLRMVEEARRRLALSEEQEAALLVERDELQREIRRLRATGDDRG